eukprot:3028116-Rhodomonas_salina.4
MAGSGPDTAQRAQHVSQRPRRAVRPRVRPDGHRRSVALGPCCQRAKVRRISLCDDDGDEILDDDDDAA